MVHKNRFCLEVVGGGERGERGRKMGEGVAQIMYTHVSKYKKDKIKK
jgi:hypothetical protein